MSQGPCLILLIRLSTRLVNPIRFFSSIHEVRVRPEALLLKSEFAYQLHYYYQEYCCIFTGAHPGLLCNAQASTTILGS